MERRSSQPIMVRKFLGEGISSPFAARLILQTFHLRDSLLTNPETIREFDHRYSAVLDNFVELKLALSNLKTLIENHLNEVAAGTAVKVGPNRQLTQMKTIDAQYRAYVKDFLIKGKIVVSAIPRVADVLGLKLLFFFGNAKKFESESRALIIKYGERAEHIIGYLRWARSAWYQHLNELRNDVEHDSVYFPPVSYHLADNMQVVATIPEPDGETLLGLLDRLESAILELLEQCILFMFSTVLPPGILIKEIPEDQRRSNNAVKYRLYAQVGDQHVPFGNLA